MLRLGILLAGETLDAVKAVHGGFQEMFLSALGALPIEPTVIKAYESEVLPEPGVIDAAIISGSPSSLTKPEPWVPQLAEWTRQMVARETPILGVCYGHQLLAYAQGVEVVENPRGYEIGTIQIDCLADAEKDPLFQGNLSVFQSVHGDAVAALPAGATALATTALTQVQAFRQGEHAWGVQFHPEFNESIIRLYVEQRRAVIRARAERSGRDPDTVMAEIHDSIRPTGAGRTLLRRFIEYARQRS